MRPILGRKMLGIHGVPKCPKMLLNRGGKKNHKNCGHQGKFFTSTSYRKSLMTNKLGKSACPNLPLSAISTILNHASKTTSQETMATLSGWPFSCRRLFWWLVAVPVAVPGLCAGDQLGHDLEFYNSTPAHSSLKAHTPDPVDLIACQNPSSQKTKIRSSTQETRRTAQSNRATSSPSHLGIPRVREPRDLGAVAGVAVTASNGRGLSASAIRLTR
jgi:hypothetical protein